MKKFIFLVPIMLLLTGCGESEGTIKCTLSSKDVVTGYELSAEYKINYKNDFAESVDTVEVVTSESEDTLEYFEETSETTYSKMSDTYGGYTYKVTNKDGKVTSTASIDYNKMDLDQFVKDQPTMKDYIKDGKMKVEGLKKMYESLGATCE